jgi:hypothetical protein
MGCGKTRSFGGVFEAICGMPWDRALCTAWAEVTTTARTRGFRIDCADAWIAATALLYGVPLVTHNRNDYRGVQGLDIILPRLMHYGCGGYLYFSLLPQADSRQGMEA